MKAKQVPFSSLMFLKATPKELIRKRRLKDRLLMAARMALLALLALVFARPYLPSEELPFVPQRESESVVVLLDRSFSMRHGDAFEQAVATVRERLDAVSAGDEVALLSFADDVQLLAPLETDLAVHRGALETTEPGYRRTDYFPALQRAQDLLQEARHRRRIVVLISDFQESGWSGALENFHLDAGILFETVPVGLGQASNAFVDDFQFSRRRVGGRYAVRYDARVAAIGDDEERERSAAFIIDGTEVGRQELPARSSAPVSFQHVTSRDGYYQGSLVLGDEAPQGADALPDDDEYFFTDRADALPGILVVDAPSGSARRDAFYLRNAFDLGEASRFRFSADGNLTDPVLRRNDIVFLANRAAAGGREVAALRDYVEDGGTLVISAGDAVDADGLTRTLDALGVGRVEGIVDARDEQGYEAIVGDVDWRHPIFAPFSGGGGSGVILSPKFRRYARLNPSEETVIVGRFDSGDVFLAERRLGSGLVIFYASTFNTSWTDLPLDEMYVPLVYQLAGYGADRSNEVRMFSVGDIVPLTGAAGETWEVRTPGGRLHRVTLDDDDGSGFFRETEVPGHYAASGGGVTRFFSINVDPRESDLRPRDPDEVYAAVIAPPDDVAATPQEAAAAAVETDERRQKLWRIFLLAVLVVFVVETYFANRRSESRTVRDVGGVV
jgi:hypothetical protein